MEKKGKIIGPLICMGIVYFFASRLGESQGTKKAEDTFREEVQKIQTNLESKLIKHSSTRDVNFDGLTDIVIEHNSGEKTVFYNTGNEYLTAEQMKQREIQKIETGYQEQLKKTNEFYQMAYGGNDLEK